MLELNYTMTAQETADATIEFLTNRPLMVFLFKLMKYSCLVLCLGFALVSYNKSTRPEDYAAVILAIIWIFYYKSINRWVVKNALKSRRFSELKPLIKIDHKGIYCKGQTNNPIDATWKSLKYILKTKNGYIIPLTGFKNAGKFLWIPFRAFNDQESEQQFLDFTKKFRLNIKKVG